MDDGLESIGSGSGDEHPMDTISKAKKASAKSTISAATKPAAVTQSATVTKSTTVSRSSAAASKPKATVSPSDASQRATSVSVSETSSGHRRRHSKSSTVVDSDNDAIMNVADTTKGKAKASTRTPSVTTSAVQSEVETSDAGGIAVNRRKRKATLTDIARAVADSEKDREIELLQGTHSVIL